MLRLPGRRVLLAASLPFLFGGAAAAQVKIAVIDAHAALAETAEIRKTQSQIEAKYKSRQDEILKLRKELESIQQQLSLGDKLTPQAQSELRNEGNRKQRQYQSLSEDLQADIEREQTAIFSKGSERMRQVLSKLADEKGLDAIIDADAMIFFRPALDVTKEATAAYDKAYPAQ